MSKFTPGPWSFDGSQVDASNGKTICEIEATSLSSEEFHNACLISAGPEMYAALQLAASLLSPADFPQLIRIVQAALTKADNC